MADPFYEHTVARCTGQKDLCLLSRAKNYPHITKCNLLVMVFFSNGHELEVTFEENSLGDSLILTAKQRCQMDKLYGVSVRFNAKPSLIQNLCYAKS